MLKSLLSEKMKKIIHINISDEGSTGKIIDSLVFAAQKKGYECILATPTKCNKSYKTYNICSKFSRLFFKLTTKIFGDDGFENRITTKKLVDFIKKEKPSIVHLHVLHGYYVNVPYLISYLKNSDISVIWTFHDFWAVTGKCPYFSLIKCERWKIGCYSCPVIHEYPKSFFFDRTKKLYDIKKNLFNDFNNLTIVPVSNWVNNYLNESICKNVYRIVIENGIPIKKPLQILKEKKREIVTVVSVAHPWGERKGLGFLNAFAEYLDNNQITNICLVVVGLQKHNKTYRTIIRYPKVEKKTLDDIYNNCDVYLNASRGETFGLTTIEALSHGMPTIVIENSGASNDIINHFCCREVKYGDVRRLYEVVTELAFLNKDGELAHHCYENALMYSEENMVSKYLKLYDEKIVF